MHRKSVHSSGALLVSILAMLLTAGCSAVDKRPTARTQPYPSRPIDSVNFVIQVGAFSSMDTSDLYKVRFGNYPTKQRALADAESVRSRGLIDVYYIVVPRQIPGTNELRNQLVHTARKYIGVAYKWGGESAREGFDCSGLTMTVYQLNGLDLPRSSWQQWEAGRPIGRDQLLKGDLVFFATSGGRRVSHVGIYAGENKFIHAPRKGKTIRTTSLSNTYYRKRYLGARRYL
jgi:cell wall-associated NlpC family hydrolase